MPCGSASLARRPTAHPPRTRVRVKAAAFSALQNCLMRVPEDLPPEPPPPEPEGVRPPAAPPPPPSPERRTQRSVANPHIATSYNPPRRGPITYDDRLQHKTFSQTVDEARRTLFRVSQTPRPPAAMPSGQRSLFGALAKARNEISAANLRRAREQGRAPPRPDQYGGPSLPEPAQFPSDPGVQPAAMPPASVAASGSVFLPAPGLRTGRGGDRTLVRAGSRGGGRGLWPECRTPSRRAPAPRAPAAVDSSACCSSRAATERPSRRRAVRIGTSGRLKAITAASGLRACERIGWKIPNHEFRMNKCLSNPASCPFAIRNSRSGLNAFTASQVILTLLVRFPSALSGFLSATSDRGQSAPILSSVRRPGTVRVSVPRASLDSEARKGASRVCRNANNVGRIFIAAWLLIVALLPAVACPADDGTATSPCRLRALLDVNRRTAPARLKIPPPRTWSKATVWPPEGQNRDSAPYRLRPCPRSRCESRPRHPLGSRAARGTPEPRRAFAAPGVRPEAGRRRAAPQPEEPNPRSSCPQAAPVVTQAAATIRRRCTAAASAPDATQPPAPPKPRSANLADSLGLPAQPEEVQVDLLSMKSKADGQVTPVGCATCGGFHSLSDGPAFHESLGCPGGSCIPGRQPCYPPAMPCNTVVGAFCQNLYQCLCCPDPCYQPTWVPAANASFFADYARPRTVTRLRYDNLESMTRPDRNQFWIQGVTRDAEERPSGHQSPRPAPAVLRLPGSGRRAWQLLHRVPLPPDQPELRTDPGRLQRPELRHQVAVVRLRVAPDHLPVPDLHANR